MRIPQADKFPAARLLPGLWEVGIKTRYEGKEIKTRYEVCGLRYEGKDRLKAKKI